MTPFCVKRPWGEVVKKLIEKCNMWEMCIEVLKTLLTSHRERIRENMRHGMSVNVLLSKHHFTYMKISWFSRPFFYCFSGFFFFFFNLKRQLHRCGCQIHGSYIMNGQYSQDKRPKYNFWTRHVILYFFLSISLSLWDLVSFFCIFCYTSYNMVFPQRIRASTSLRVYYFSQKNVSDCKEWRKEVVAPFQGGRQVRNLCIHDLYIVTYMKLNVESIDFNLFAYIIV